MVFVDRKKMCFLVNNIYLPVGSSVIINHHSDRSITAYPIIDDDAYLRETEAIAMSFNSIAESLLQNQTTGNIFMLKPGQGKETFL